ncbi:hypothetical protein HYU40_03400 [Candidatus Woesearchaeota archaeon]|nr:hypothetical protein [Candidatus Woesearchaeota archaeon]
MAFGYDIFAVYPVLAAVTILALWEIAWKGVGLWLAARNSHKWWFIAILIFNTLGILPIVYYLFFSGRQVPQQPAAQPKPARKKHRVS